MDDPIGNAARQRKQRARLGAVRQCAQCAERDEAALVPGTKPVICYECKAIQDGRSPVEAHHPAGRNNHPATVPLLGNDHRVLSDLQVNWPRETLRNPDGSPLRAAAACIRGWLDAIYLIMTRTVQWIPDYLEQLDDWLGEKIGPRWWTGGPVPAVFLQ